MWGNEVSGPGRVADSEKQRQKTENTPGMIPPRQGLEPLEPRILLSASTVDDAVVEQVVAAEPEVLASISGDEQVTVQQTQYDTLFSPNVLAFDFPIDPDAVKGHIVIYAYGDLNGAAEYLTYDIEGILTGNLFQSSYTGLGPFGVSLSNLTDAKLAAIAADGNLHIEFTPTAEVDDYSEVQEYLTTSVTYDIPVPQLAPTAVSPHLLIGAYHDSHNGEIGAPNDVDKVEFALLAGQTLRLEAVPENLLSLSIDVIDPTGATIYSATSAAPGQAILDQPITVSEDGDYTVVISSDGATQGLYSLNVFVNEYIESESIGGPTNDTVADAQSLDAYFRDIGAGMQLATVRGNAFAYVPNANPEMTTTYTESFEDATLPDNWSITESSNGRVRFANNYDAPDGYYVLVLDSIQSYGTLSEVVWTVDLSGANSAILSFNYAEWSDGSNLLPTSYSGSYNGDGVSISADGINWYTVLNAPNSPNGEWQYAELDLMATVLDAGITPGPNFQIKFQQFGSYAYSSYSGRRFDNIRLEASQANTSSSPLPDFYKVTLDADQFVSLSVTNADGNPIGFKLYDPQGEYIPNTTFTSSDGLAGFYDFKPMIGGEYAIEITEATDDYWVSVLLGGTLEANDNNDISQAQRIGRTGAVFGAIDVQAQQDYYKVSAIAGDTLTFESAMPGHAYTMQDVVLPYLMLYDPTGAFVASALTDVRYGLTALLSHTAEMTGDYTLVVRDNSNTLTGVYTIDADGFTGAQDDPFEVVYSTVEDGRIYSGSPSLNPYRLTMSSPVLSHSLSVDDMSINDITPTRAYVVWDTNDISFTLGLPRPIDGDYVVNIPAGAIRDLHGAYNEAFSLQFTVDTIPPIIIESSILEGDVVSAGDVTIKVKFSEPVRATDGTLEGALFLNYDGTNFDESAAVYDPVTDELTVTYDDITTEGVYRFTLASSGYVFTDLAGNRLDGEANPETTVPTGNGSVQGNFVVYFGVEDGLSQPLEPAEPISSFGSFAYRSGFSGVSEFLGDEDRYAFDLAAGQSFSIATDSVPGFVQMDLELYAPGGGLIATSNDGIGALENLIADEDGTYTLLLRSVDQPEPSFYDEYIEHRKVYTGEVLFGAVHETEEIGGTSNDTLGTAQDIAPALHDIGGGIQQAVIIGGRQEIKEDIFESFESGTLGTGWSTGPAGEPYRGRVEVTDVIPASDGTYALIMDTEGGGFINRLGEAIWRLDLTGYDDAYLTFDVSSKADYRHELPTEFTGHYDGDGIAISNDGVNWYTFLSGPSGHGTEWNEYDRFQRGLAGTAHAAGLELGSSFYIKFQRFDNWDRSYGWLGFDNIRITTPAVTPTTLPDVYSIALSAGDLLSVAVDGGAHADALELLDSTGQVFSYGESNWIDAKGSIRNFIAPTDGTYYIRVTQADDQYTLITTLNANYLPEPRHNRVLDLDRGGKVVAAINPSGDTDRYELQVIAGDTLNLWTETLGADSPAYPNTLDTLLELIDPEGNTVASSRSGGDGLNALINHTATLPGTYTLVVSSENATVGGYVLMLDGSSAGAAPFEVSSANLPANGHINTTPSQITIDFNQMIRLDTDDATDLSINGQPAIAVTVIDGNSLRFDLPVLTEGVNTFEFSGGAIQSLSDMPLLPFTSTLTVDSVAPRIISSSISPGDSVTPGPLTVTIQFDEQLYDPGYASDPAWLSPLDGSSQIRAVTDVYDPATSTLTLEFAPLEEGSYQLIVSDYLSDLAFNYLDGEAPDGPVPPNVSGDGVEGGRFVVDFEVDRNTQSPAIEFQAVPPFGSLAATSNSHYGVLTNADDTDPFRVYMQPGQVLGAMLRPFGPTTIPTAPGSVLSLSAPGVSAIAPGPYDKLALTYVHTGPAGYVDLIVGSDTFVTQSKYRMDLVLNASPEAALQRATHVSSPAMDLDAIFVDLPDSNASVANIFGQGRIAPSLESYGNVFRYNNLYFSFDGLPEPTGDATLSLTALADVGTRNSGLVVVASQPFDYMFMTDGSSSVPLTQSVTLTQELLEYRLDNGELLIRVLPNSGVTDLGWSELIVSLDYPGVSFDPADTYALNLQINQSISVVLDSEPGSFLLELVDADTNQVLIQPTSADGFDALLRNWVAPATGTYLIKVTALDVADYFLSVTKDAVAHVVSPLLDADPLALNGPTTALGYLRDPGEPRLFALAGDADWPYLTQNLFELDPVTLEQIGSIYLEGIPAGVNHVAYADGILYAAVLASEGTPYGPGVIYAIDPDTGQVINSFTVENNDERPSTYLLGVFGSEAVIVTNDDTMIFIDLLSGEMTRMVNATPSYGSTAITGAPERGSVFWADYGGGDHSLVYEIDAYTGTLINTLTLSYGYTRGLSFTNGQLIAYHDEANTLATYDPDTGALISSNVYPEDTFRTIGGGGNTIGTDSDRYTLGLNVGPASNAYNNNPIPQRFESDRTQP